jgi:hypothetical protein
MPNMLLLKTNKVVLPYTQYTLNSSQLDYVKRNSLDPQLLNNCGMYITAIYEYKKTLSNYGTSCQFLYGNLINAELPIWGMFRLKPQLLTSKLNVDTKNYQGVYSRYLKPMDEELNENLLEQVLSLAGVNREELLANFNNQEYALSVISYIILDTLVPGKNHRENLLRLEYLAERSENRRLRKIKKYLQAIK